MQVKELQLDDWVYGIDGAGGKHPSVISAVDIYPTNKTPRIVTLGGYGYQQEQLEPIPLTQAILAANFGMKNNTGLYGISDDYYDFDIYEINDGTYLARYHNCEMSSIPDEQVLVCYVHQLQHFMRHCLIEEDIRL